MAKNIEKFDHMWNQYQSDIRAFLHSKISNLADVDDLFQEILIKSYNHLDALKSEKNVKSWLFQIAHHTIIDFYRKKGKLMNMNIDDLWYWEEKEDDVKGTLAQCIQLFIQSSPPESAELLKVIDIEGSSQKEYAEKIGVSYSTLKSRIQKERRNLRKNFEDCCLVSFDTQGNITDFKEKSNHDKKC